MDDYSVIGRSLFKKETNIQLFVGLKVHLSTGELGTIDSAFGQSGKFKIHIPGECGYFLLPIGAMQDVDTRGEVFQAPLGSGFQACP